MSYILDALRKADTDRDRGAVPGLHTQSAARRPERPVGRSPAPWVMAVAGAGLALLAAAGVAWWRSEPPPSAVAASVAASPDLASSPAPVAPLPAPAPAPAPVPTPAERLEVPAAPDAPVAAPATPVTPVTRVPPTSRAAAASAARAATVPAAAAAEPRIYALNELPEALRRDLPALAVGGSMYSDAPAQRMLILNGQVVHENDTLARDLVLEQIGLKSAVLRFRGTRLRLTY